METQNKISGIYIIHNIVNDYFYVGQSVDIHNRWYNHKSMLNCGHHDNIFLQRVWNKYGKESFEFKILEITPNDRDILNIQETYWFEHCKGIYGADKALNLHKTGDAHNMSEALKKILSEKHRGIKTWNSGKKCPQLSGTNNPMYGKHVPEECKEKIRAALKKYRQEHPEEAARMNSCLHNKGEEPWNKGKHVSQTSGSNNYNAQPVLQYTLSGEFVAEYETCKEASEHTGVPRSNICKCCKGLRNYAGGFIWEYKNNH